MTSVPWPSASKGIVCSSLGSNQLLVPPRQLGPRAAWSRSTPVSKVPTTTPCP